MIRFKSTALALLATILIARTCPAQTTDLNAPPPVTLTEDANSYIMSNGIITAKVAKRNGDLTSMVYKGIQTLYVPAPGANPANGGHPWGYWEQTPNVDNVKAVTIDPATNNGERAEVSIKGFYGTSGELGTGAPGGGAACDIELRYALGRGESGIYTTAIYTHQASYGTGNIGESRWGAKLNPAVFDWLSVDANRNKMMLTSYDWAHGTQLNGKEMFLLNSGIYKGLVEHKYDYCAVLFDTPAFGWSSTTNHIGWWCINPSQEFIGGGPTKVELTCHRDLNQVAAPTILDYWRGTHYGGTQVTFAASETWQKVVGPIFNYCNSGATPNEMFQDALAQAAKEKAAWPYPWVNNKDIDYPDKDHRATVKGQIVLNDPYYSGKMWHVRVGLTHDDYPAAGRGGGGAGTTPRLVDWAEDAKYYQFWVNATDIGNFKIPNVRPGHYTLHAIADGVLGEFVHQDVLVAPSLDVDLHQMVWQPVRYGQQLWDIGIPDRTAGEFLHGNHYWQWGLYLQYANDFPHDVNYVIGKSNFHTDWNYAEVPHGNGKDYRVNGKPTTWSVIYNMDAVPNGTAILRLSICGAGGCPVNVSMNDRYVGTTGPLRYNATINRDGIEGELVEKDIAFDAGIMQKGRNVLKLSIPGGQLTNGVEYDYVRLELNEAQVPPPTPIGPPAAAPAGRGGYGRGGAS